jgi:hypothetical protein
MGPRAGLNAMEKGRISCPCQELNPGHLGHLTIPTELSRLDSFDVRDIIQEHNLRVG